MKSKVSLLTTVICCLLVFVATFAIPMLSKQKTQVPAIDSSIVKNDCATNMDQIRLKRYEFIQPLLMANLMTESTKLQGLRTKIEGYINEVKSNQKAEDITVYFRKMNNGEWFCVNPNQTYNPASMSKIIYILTYLKEAEYNPNALNKRVFFAKHFSEGNQQNIQNFTLKENAYYTVKQLMDFMIQYSDNDATLLLSQNMNVGIYQQIFKDLDLPTPPTAGEYYITALDYSKFFRVLYNASYIRPEYSEYALGLLTQSTYKDGLCAGVPANYKIAHKFGERIIGDKAQLHEFGIIFYDGDPYMLGIMSKGSSLKQLSEILAQISRITFDEVSAMPNS
jgi:beta-lactamase class A